MDRRELAIGLIVGVVAGVLLVGVAISTPEHIFAQSLKAIEQCEASLPRSQKCVITAVPGGESE